MLFADLIQSGDLPGGAILSRVGDPLPWFPTAQIWNDKLVLIARGKDRFYDSRIRDPENGKIFSAKRSASMISFHGDNSFERASLREIGRKISDVGATIDHGISGNQPSPTPLHLVNFVAATDKKNVRESIAASSNKPNARFHVPDVTSAADETPEL